MATRARRKDAGTTQAEGPKHNHVFRDFGGINTQAARQAIKPEEFSWIENIMPIGHGNARIVPSRSEAIATLPTGGCYYMHGYNLAGDNYLAMACSDGSLYQVALDSPYGVTLIDNGFATSGIEITQWGNTYLLIIDPVNGYFAWDGSALTQPTGAPATGEHIASFSGHVWISTNRTISFSAPGTYDDWTSTGSGLVNITDSTLSDNITQLISANNFLYFTGGSSINVIGDVNVDSLGDTIFSNTNISASIGTNQSDSVIPYYRALWFVNRSGVYSIAGSTPTKVSDALDGIFQNIDFTFPISSAQMFLYNILCVSFLVKYQDKVLGAARPILVIYFNKKWFVADQGGGLVFVATGTYQNTQSIYGTDGSRLYKLFDDATTPVSWKLQSALWDAADVTRDKQVTKFGFEGTVSNTGTVTIDLDTLSSIPPFIQTDSYQVAVSSAVIWINNMGDEVTWQNNSSLLVTWAGVGYFMDMEDGTAFGKYVGITMTSDDIIGTITSEMLEYTFRVRW